MKGTVHKAIERLITENFGRPTWEKCLVEIGFDEDHVFMMNDDVDEATTMRLVTEVIPRVCNLSLQQVLDAFGQYWINGYAAKVYAPYFEGCKTTKELILKLDFIHKTLTENIPNAKPPRLKYEWVSDNRLAVTYFSERGLIDLFISIAHGAGTYYNEKLNITRKSDQVLEIDFAA
jgi:hypothetical protein